MDYSYGRAKLVIADSNERKYIKVQGLGKRTWYYPDERHPDRANHIFVDYHDPNSRGYGGGTLEFNLIDGTTDFVKGPWHSNSASFYADTGIDLRQQNADHVCIAFDFEGAMSHSTLVMKDIIVWDGVSETDDGHVLNFKEGRSYKDVRTLANLLSKLFQRTVYVYEQRAGGSTFYGVPYREEENVQN